MTEETVGGFDDPRRRIIEALIFASDEPLSILDLRGLLGEDTSASGAPAAAPEGMGPDAAAPANLGAEEIRKIIDSVNEEYSASHRAFRIIEIAGGFQFSTLPEFAQWLGRLFREHARRRLSQSALETLSIVSYKQPVSKPEIEAIRGVNADYVLKTLLEKNLVTIIGRASTPGRPLLYGTTQEFLRRFGLRDLDDLPKPREINELFTDDEDVRQRVMRELRDGETEVGDEELDLFMKEHLHLGKTGSESPSDEAGESPEARPPGEGEQAPPGEGEQAPQGEGEQGRDELPAE